MSCKHEFVKRSDWEGDASAGPSYVNEIVWWQCLHCDEERNERPPENEIYEPDYEALRSGQWN